MFGVVADIFGDSIISFIPKILQSLTKIIKEEATSRLHISISDTLGEIVHHTIGAITDQEEQQNLFDNQYLKFVYGLVDK